VNSLLFVIYHFSWIVWIVLTHEFKNRTDRYFSHIYKDVQTIIDISVSHMTTNMFHNPILSSFRTYHRVCNKSDSTGATSRAGTTYPIRSTCVDPNEIIKPSQNCHFSRFKNKWPLRNKNCLWRAMFGNGS
jgi:hypothetical protein